MGKVEFINISNFNIFEFENNDGLTGSRAVSR